MRFLIRIYREDGDYSALVPDLPGCVAAGDSVEEVRALITKAIQMHLEMLQKSGEAVPIPTRHLDLDAADLEDQELCTWVEVKPLIEKARRKQRVAQRK